MECSIWRERVLQNTFLSVRLPPSTFRRAGRPQFVQRALPTHVFACSPPPFSDPPARSAARPPRSPRGRSGSTHRARVDPGLFPARIPRLGACPRGSRATRGCRSRRCARDRRTAARAAASPRAPRALPEPSTARYARPRGSKMRKRPLGKTNNTRFTRKNEKLANALRRRR